MLEPNDFYDDQLLLRQVKRAQRKAALEMDEDDADESGLPVEPEELDDEDDSSIQPERQRPTIMSMKREQQTRGPSIAPKRSGSASGDQMEEDESS